jgi:molecular chaperone DnaJ
MEDYYKLLGIEKGATPDEIKKAYRKMAHKYHPDRNSGDKASEQKFKEVSAAYETLSDPKKRSMYDQFGHAGTQQGGFQGGGFDPNNFSGGFDFSSFAGDGTFADIFESFFGGGGSSSRRETSKRGEDLELKLTVEFLEAAFGATKKIRIRRVVRCDRCDASGAEPKTKIISCDVCKGTGQIKDVKRTILGQIMTSRVCDNCRGTGQIPEKPCNKCNGVKRFSFEESITVKIPKGINNNAVIRLAGKGNEGEKEGFDGDLYIRIEIEPSKKFKREGTDIYSEVEIHTLQAVLGDEIEIETIHGRETLVIPPGTQPNKVFKIKGKGVPYLNSDELGDHYVTVGVYMPKKISKKERDLYLKLVEESGINIKPGKSGLLW